MPTTSTPFFVKPKAPKLHRNNDRPNPNTSTAKVAQTPRIEKRAAMSTATSNRPKLPTNAPCSLRKGVKKGPLLDASVAEHLVKNEIDMDDLERDRLLFMQQEVDDLLEAKEKEVDIKLGQLAMRFENNMYALEAYSKRLKEIEFTYEREQLIKMREKDFESLIESTKASNLESVLDDLSTKQQSRLDRVELKNVDLGYSEESGHKKLLDSIQEAIDQIKEIKRESNLDPSVLQAYSKTGAKVDTIDATGFHLSNMKREFDTMFPKANQKLLIDTSKKLDGHLNCDNDDCNSI